MVLVYVFGVTWEEIEILWVIFQPLHGGTKQNY